MAHSLSARKRVRQNETHRVRNRDAKSRMRTLIKKFRILLEEGNVEDARDLFPRVAHEIDVTAKKGVIHKNTASRYKSRLSVLLNRSVSV